MILAIVGSTKLVNHPDVFKEVRRVIFLYRPDEVVSGGADGVDNTVEKVARELGVAFRAFRPEVHQWDGNGQVGYKQRNQQIATLCDRLVRIVEVNPETYGSGWTRDLAAKMGKPTEEKIIAA